MLILKMLLSDLMIEMKTLFGQLATKIDKIETKVDNLETKLEMKVDNLEKKVDNLETKLEIKVDNLEKKFEMKVDNLEKKFQNRFELLENNFASTNEKSYKKIDKRITGLENNIRKGMGISFEYYNKSWLQKYLNEKYPNIKLESSKRFKDKDSVVNPVTKHKEFEVDIYCENLRLVAECTTNVTSDEMDKIKKKVRIKEFFQDSTIYLFFCTYDIHESIKSDAIAYCEENKIELIIKANLE